MSFIAFILFVSGILCKAESFIRNKLTLLVNEMIGLFRSYLELFGSYLELFGPLIENLKLFLTVLPERFTKK